MPRLPPAAVWLQMRFIFSEKGTTTCRLRLPVQIADDETGLYYNRFRYY